jgi:hypothetical protein
MASTFAGNDNIVRASPVHHRHSFWRCFAASPSGRGCMVKPKLAA